jgi:hypothetical protein
MSTTNWIQNINKTPTLEENVSYEKLVQNYFNVILNRTKYFIIIYYAA